MSGLVAYISSDEDEVEVTEATNSAEVSERIFKLALGSG